MVVPATRKLLVQLPDDLPALVAREPEIKQPTIPAVTELPDLGQFEPETPQPALEETPVLARESPRTKLSEEEIQAAFEEFKPQPTPDPAPEFEAMVIRERVPDYSEMFVESLDPCTYPRLMPAPPITEV